MNISTPNTPFIVPNNDFLPTICIDILQKIQHETGKILDHQELDFIVDFLKNNYQTLVGMCDDQLLSTILNHPQILEYCNTYIQQKIETVLNMDSTYCFEELSFYLFLLSQSYTKQPLESVSQYNFELLEEIFDALIMKLNSEKIEPQQFILYYNLFLTLCDVLNELCIFNQMDPVRMPLIPQVADLVFKKVNEVLLYNSHLTQERKNRLEFILSRFGINFEHSKLIQTPHGEPIDTLERGIEHIENIFGAYQRAKKSEFGGNPEKKSQVHSVSLGNAAYIVLDILQRVENDTQQLLSSPEYMRFQEVLKEFFDISIDGEITLEEIKSHALGVLVGMYNVDDTTKIVNTDDVLQDAVQSDIGQLGAQKLESIYNVLLFSDDVSLESLKLFGSYLVDTPKLSNYNLEFFKLNIIELIVQRLSDHIDSIEIQVFFDDIFQYVNKNKLSSQLLHIYANIYLILAFSYAKGQAPLLQDKALECYSIFQKIGNQDAFQGYDFSSFYTNIGRFYITHDFGDIGDMIPSAQVIKFGETKVNKYFLNYEILTRDTMLVKLSQIFQRYLSGSISDTQLLNKISDIINQEVFYGIPQCSIIFGDEQVIGEGELKSFAGSGVFSIQIYGEYTLRFVYPKTYEQVFLQILESQRERLILPIKNVITTHMRVRESFIDSKTGLPNTARLHSILEDNDAKKTFIVFKLTMLGKLNRGYSHELGDQYLSVVGQQLAKIPELKNKVFKLSGSKFGIICSDDPDGVEVILAHLRNIKVNIDGIDMKMNFIAGIATSSKNDFLEKSGIALVKAIQSGSEYEWFMQEDEKHHLEQIDMLDKLKILDNAIENDGIKPFFQPIFDRKGNIVRYECLMRIEHEGEYRSIYPFLEIAKFSGKRKLLTTLMIQKVFEFVKDNQYNFSINLGGEDLLDHELLEYLQTTLKNYAISPQRITFEVLESAWRNDGILGNIIALKKMGFKIAMDDYGAESSNGVILLSSIELGVLDEIKIDGKMVQSLKYTKNQPLYDRLHILKNDMIEFLELQQTAGKASFRTTTLQRKVSEDIGFISTLSLFIHNELKALLEVKTPNDVERIFESIFHEIQTKGELFPDSASKLLSGVIECAHNFGIKVTAEFIEDKQLLDLTTQLGCDYFQGFHFQLPQPIIENNHKIIDKSQNV